MFRVFWYQFLCTQNRAWLTVGIQELTTWRINLLKGWFFSQNVHFSYTENQSNAVSQAIDSGVRLLGQIPSLVTLCVGLSKSCASVYPFIEWEYSVTEKFKGIDARNVLQQICLWKRQINILLGICISFQMFLFLSFVHFYGGYFSSRRTESSWEHPLGSGLNARRPYSLQGAPGARAAGRGSL